MCVCQRFLTSYHHLPIWEHSVDQSDYAKYSPPMSTTPPKKGKKRAPPSTPTERPLAKASRASSPARTEDAPSGFAPRSYSSVLPEIPPFRSPGSTSAGLQPAFEFIEDPSAQEGTEQEGHEPDNADDTLAFTTVDDDIDESEANDSFNKLASWIRYLAQYKGQQGRLTSLFDEATSSLRALSGDSGQVKPASYAAAAATSAPPSSGSRRPTAPPTARQSKRSIQNAVNRYERVSRELPGAPKDTLLRIVARSDLSTAVPPLPALPKPRKKPNCLVKGIRANPMAVRLPPDAWYPPSLPALIVEVNKALKKAESAGTVKEILQGVRRHLTIVFHQTVDDATSKLALAEVLKAFRTKEEDAHVLDRPTFSLLKFTAVPTITTDGRPVTVEIATACLQKHPEWKKEQPLEAPRFVPNKANPDPYHATLLIKIRDTQKASMAKKLLETSVSFVGVTRRCQPWTVSTTARQCSTCLKWGHTAYICKARFSTCDQCAGPHLSSLHEQHAHACHDKHCAPSGIRCANCDESHHASSMMCAFFRNRSSPSELQKLQKARVERICRRLSL